MTFALYVLLAVWAQQAVPPPAIDSNDGNMDAQSVTWQPHVIEIRTKRKLNGKAEACYYATTNGSPNCEEIKYDGHCPTGAYCHELYEETHYIYVDGVKWGVLKEAEDKP